MGGRRGVAAAFGCAAALLLAGCGGGSGGGGGDQPHSHTVDVDAMLPLAGPEQGEAEAITSGIRLALSQARGRAGRWTVRFTVLSDASTPLGMWTDGATEAAARRVATNPAAVLAIGDLDSGASAVSSPLLAEAGVPQISPGSPEDGLTGAPDVRTGRDFLRLDASDRVEAAAELEEVRGAGCTKVAIVAGPDTGETESAELIASEASAAGLSVIGPTSATAAPEAIADALQGHALRCVVIAASTAPPEVLGDSAVGLADDVHEILPRALIVGGPPLCTPLWTDALEGGVVRGVDPYLRCTEPTLPVADDPGGQRFSAAYERAFHQAPTGEAALGYAAMTLGLDAIRAAGGRGDDRDAVRAELLARRPRSTVLGPVAFSLDGDVVPSLVGVYGARTGGALVLLHTLKPTVPAG